MKVRYFIGIAVLFIIIVGGYSFYILPDEYTLKNTLFYDFSLTLPIALWICVPLIILLIIAWIFMSVSSIIFAFKTRSLNKDKDKLVLQIQEQALGGSAKDRIFANKQLKELSLILKRFNLDANTKSALSNNEKIDSIINGILDIENGVFLQKSGLSQNNPLFLMNVKNSIKDSQRAFEVLKKEYTNNSSHGINASDVYDKAWNVILESKNSKIINKALELKPNYLSLDMLIHIALSSSRNEISVSSGVFISVLKYANFSEREYLRFAIEISKTFSQNNINFWLSVFEALSKDIEHSVFAYFYVLLEVGKTSEAMELKRQYPKNDFLPVSAFSKLKDEGYPLLVFFDPLMYRENKFKKESNKTKVITQPSDV